MNHIASGGSSETRVDEFELPREIFDIWNAFFEFDIDSCASHANALLTKYWTKEDDALKQDWSKLRIYNNCPYSLKLKFLEKAKEATFAVLLLPNDVEAKWFHKYSKLCETWLLEGRIQFLLNGKRPTRICKKTGKVKVSGNNKGSMLMIFGAGANKGRIHTISNKEIQEFVGAGITWRDYCNARLDKFERILTFEGFDK